MRIFPAFSCIYSIKLRPFRNILLLTALLTLYSPLSLSAEVKEYHLQNGLKALVIEDHKAPVATIQVWYRIGSRNEVTGSTGISHLLEHMMFKGTPRYGTKALSRLVQKNGGIDNAFTTKDYTTYYQTIASDRIGLSIELEADRMQNLLLKPDDVISERDVVKEERRMRYEDNPQRSLYEGLIAAAFKVHPYRNPVIGWMSEVSHLKREALLQHYKRYYSPDNAVIIVAGDVTAEDIIARIRDKFGAIARGPGRTPVVSVEPAQNGERRLLLHREDAKLPYVLIAYHAPNLHHKDSAALDLLSTLLSGKSGRLYRRMVREEKVALNAFASYNGLNIDPYLFILGGTAAPGKDIASVEKALYEEIEKIQAEAPSIREVQKAKNQTEAYLIMGLDSIFFQAEFAGMFEMLGGWQLQDKYLEDIGKVTPGDIQRVAGRYFSQRNRTVAILMPDEEADKAAESRSIREASPLTKPHH